MNKIGISGKNLRLLYNELNNSRAEIVFNNIHTIQIHINDGTPQGHCESGPIWNIYTNSTLSECLAVVTKYYKMNVSTWFYADDGIKIALNLSDLRCFTFIWFKNSARTTQMRRNSVVIFM